MNEQYSSFVLHGFLFENSTLFVVVIAVIFECVRTASELEPNDELLSLCANHVSRFLSNDNPNIKYVGVKCLTCLVRVDAKYAALHQKKVIECLESTDQSLKRNVSPSFIQRRSFPTKRKKKECFCLSYRALRKVEKFLDTFFTLLFFSPLIDYFFHIFFMIDSWFARRNDESWKRPGHRWKNDWLSSYVSRWCVQCRIDVKHLQTRWKVSFFVSTFSFLSVQSLFLFWTVLKWSFSYCSEIHRECDCWFFQFGLRFPRRGCNRFSSVLFSLFVCLFDWHFWMCISSFSEDSFWFVRTLVTVFSLGTSLVNDEMIHRLLRLLAHGSCPWSMRNEESNF